MSLQLNLRSRLSFRHGRAQAYTRSRQMFRKGLMTTAITRCDCRGELCVTTYPHNCREGCVVGCSAHNDHSKTDSHGKCSEKGSGTISDPEGGAVVLVDVVELMERDHSVLFWAERGGYVGSVRINC
jgi:hypothetical protein